MCSRFIAVTLHFTETDIYIYIYAFIYVGYTEKQYIEKQDALSAVSCSLREMERHSNEPATLLNERTKKYKSLITHSRNEKVHFFIKVSVAFCNFIFSADTDWGEITSLLTNN